MQKNEYEEKCMRSGAIGSIWGLIVGDALGVPVEFCSREELKEQPVTDMRGYGTHYQPIGTWSDDSSMMLCTFHSLCGGLDYSDIMEHFSRWYFDAEFTPHGSVFDSGAATARAMNKYRDGVRIRDCGGRGEHDNGNGSLMRILPIALYQYFRCNQFAYNDRPLLINPIHAVSALTHANAVSMIGCGLFSNLLADALNQRCGFWDCNWPVQQWNDYSYNGYGNLYGDHDYRQALGRYDRLRDLKQFACLSENEIRSSGYVVSTLEAAVWCLLNTSSFEECVLKAVNLGEDTDTVGAVAGSLAGAKYGIEGIPRKWLTCLARYEWIESLIERFMDTCADGKKGPLPDEEKRFTEEYGWSWI